MLYSKKKNEKNICVLILFLVILPSISCKVFGDKNSDATVWFADSISDSLLSAYGHRSSISVVKDSEKDRGTVLKLTFDDDTYSGMEIMSPAENGINLGSIRKKGAISLLIKGDNGNETVYIGFMDRGDDKKNKTEVKRTSNQIFTVTKQWQRVKVPLSSFSDEGNRWINDKQATEYSKIDWAKIFSITFSTDKGQNLGRCDDRKAILYVDEIRLIDSCKQRSDLIPWSMCDNIITGPDLQKEENERVLFPFLGDKPGKYTFLYTYGPPTDYTVICSRKPKNSSILACWFDDSEWSGVTLSRGNNHPINIAPYMETGGVEFKVKGTEGGEQFYIGLLDDDSDGVDRNVQSRVKSMSVVKVTKSWQSVKVPFSLFSEMGKWWNPLAHYEAVGKMDWTRITQVRFSTDRLANKHVSKEGRKPVPIYFADIKFVKDIEVFTNEQYWEKFHSDSPDKLLNDFETALSISNWSKNLDPKSMMAISKGTNSKDGSEAVKMDYNIKVWGSMVYPIAHQDSSLMDWSKHSGLKFDFYSSEKSQTCMVLILDASHEAWYAYFEAPYGWSEISVPFSKFEIFEQWQHEMVDVNGKMDMGKVYSYDFRPGVTGKEGTIMIDNLRLTNKGFPPRKE